ncbi:protein MHF1 [Sesamum angolense]|uniref:Protein MHF1 n=1 Tax=Sesamum angolense TaxID=2727404 RepID=A0AAE2C6A5_9LAMI|nr:protein MHF1 [Sesamum angolense]
MGSDVDRGEEEEESASELLRDRFRLCTISVAEAEAKQNGMEVSQPIVACISDLAFKYAQQLAKDLELFAQHAGRKSVNMEDVILSGKILKIIRVYYHSLKKCSRVLKSALAKFLHGFLENDFYLAETQLQWSHLILLPLLTFFTAHRNDNLAASLRSFCNDLKAKEPQSDRKRKKNTKKENKAAEDVLHIADP